jgi:hypothetical protein
MILGPSQSPYEGAHAVRVSHAHSPLVCVQVFGLNTPCAGGVYKLELFLPDEYPMSAPKALARFPRFWVLLRAHSANPRLSCCASCVRLQVRFLTKIYHPNIDKARPCAAPRCTPSRRSAHSSCRFLCRSWDGYALTS